MSESKIIFKCISSKPIAKDESIMHNKNSRRFKEKFDRVKYEKKELIWSLNRYWKKEVYIGFDMQPRSSDQKLDDKFVSSKILELVNTEDLFDFNYVPKKDDLLSFWFEYVKPILKSRDRPRLYAYISFIYYDEKWNINKGFDSLGNLYQEIGNGTVEYLEEQW